MEGDAPFNLYLRGQKAHPKISLLSPAKNVPPRGMGRAPRPSSHSSDSGQATGMQWAAASHSPTVTNHIGSCTQQMIVCDNLAMFWIGWNTTRFL